VRCCDAAAAAEACSSGALPNEILLLLNLVTFVTFVTFPSIEPTLACSACVSDTDGHAHDVYI